jgi:nucleotide-binding universal stress UspA family protein
MLSVHTILHPSDFSSLSANSLAVAASLARDCGARLVLLHVLGEPALSDGMGLVPFDSAMYRDWMRDRLDQVAERYPDIRLEERLTEGNVVQEILRAAEETGCDLIVMGAHGWSGLRHVLMGSIAEGVARRAPCPVVTVRMPVKSAVQAVEPITTGPHCGLFPGSHESPGRGP